MRKISELESKPVLVESSTLENFFEIIILDSFGFIDDLWHLKYEALHVFLHIKAHHAPEKAESGCSNHRVRLDHVKVRLLGSFVVIFAPWHEAIIGIQDLSV